MRPIRSCQHGSGCRGRFRSALLERARGGGAAHAGVAREEDATRYQVARAFAGRPRELDVRREARTLQRLSLDDVHRRRGHELATVVSDLDRRRVVEVLDGRSRHRGWNAICAR